MVTYRLTVRAGELDEARRAEAERLIFDRLAIVWLDPMDAYRAHERNAEDEWASPAIQWRDAVRNAREELGLDDEIQFGVEITKLTARVRQLGRWKEIDLREFSQQDLEALTARSHDLDLAALAWAAQKSGQTPGEVVEQWACECPKAAGLWLAP